MACGSIRTICLGLVALGLAFVSSGVLAAEEPAAATAPAQDDESELAQPWLEPIPVPFDPELEALIEEIQDGLKTIHRQMVRRKESVDQTQDPAAKAAIYEELEALRKERDELRGLLNKLVEEAKISELTEIDEALARARWLEQREERWEKKEELIRDRQP